MTSLLQAAAADVREAASYAPKEAMPMSTEMTNERAADVLARFSDGWTGESRKALLLAIAALRAQPEPGLYRDYEGEIAKLLDQRDASETQRCEYVNLYRDAEQRAETLERALRLALDALDAKEAGF